MKIKFLIPICLAMSQLGCATMFSEAKQGIRIKSNPERVTVLIFGGALGSLIKYGVKGSEIVKLLGSSLSEKDRRFLETHDFESILTAIVLEIRGNIPLEKSTSVQVAEVLAKIPKPVKEKLLEKLGLAEFAVTPVTAELPRGGDYAVIGWKAGHKIKIEILKRNFNWATLWNIFNLGLGVPIDIYTGAWSKLSTTELELDVTKEATKL